MSSISYIEEKKDEPEASYTQATEPSETFETKLYKKRWLMLTLFVFVTAINGFHGVQFAIIADVIQKYYGVSYALINMTSTIYMIVYIPLVLPGDMMTERKGLKLTVILGIGFCTIGAWIKVASVAPDRFYVGFIGQIMEAFAQIFILGIPSRLAAVWFGHKEVSTACAIAVLGNQFGCAVGFVLPPYLVPSTGTMDEIGTDLLNMYYGVAAFSSVIFILVLIFFKKEPMLPPSQAQASALVKNERTSYKEPLLRLLTNKPFLILVLSYGLIVSMFNVFSTLLNQLILPHFPGHTQDVGMIGLCIILFGMLGSLICGFIFDRTKKFRETIIAVYILSLLSMIIFTFTLKIPNIAVVYCTASLIGFFLAGYIPLGFEYGVELTYPEPESTSSALLNISQQVFSIIFITGGGVMLNALGDIPLDSTLCGILLIGCVLTYCTKGTLRRQQHSMFIPDEHFVPDESTNASIANLPAHDALASAENGIVKVKR